MILVDTHILIWDALVPDRLSQRAARALAQNNQDGAVLISDISLWKIAMLIQKGRVEVNTDIQSFISLLLQANDLQVRPITPHIAALSVQLPADITLDPADRLIVATALTEDIPLVTADRNLRSSAIIRTMW